MPLQQNVAARLAYKAHTATTIAANTLLTLASDPAATGGQVLRRTRSTLGLKKQTYRSNEVRVDRQVADLRHGPGQVEGEIGGELSPGTYTDFIEAVLRCTKVATFDKSESDFTSVEADSSGRTFTVGGSTWAAQGFRVGDMIRFASLSETANNARNFLITALSGTAATVYPAPTTMTADSAFTVTRLGNKMFPPASAIVDKLFLFEHYHADIDTAQLFQECRIASMALSIPASGLVGVTFGVMGRAQSIVDSSSAPFFSSPAAAGTAGIASAADGLLTVAGSTVGIVTGLEISCAMPTEAPIVVGQNFPADIMLGELAVTGQATVLLTDKTFLNYFSAETEVEIAAMMTTTSAANSPGFSVFLPRVKFTGADVALEGQPALPITMPFQALLKGTATGYDAASIVITDNTA